MIVIHGDRIEALASALVGSLNHILTAHIEGGEVSGTIDDTIRHTITKFSNFHFVSNSEYKKRVIQLGENPKNIFYQLIFLEIQKCDYDITQMKNTGSRRNRKKKS